MIRGFELMGEFGIPNAMLSWAFGICEEWCSEFLNSDKNPCRVAFQCEDLRVLLSLIRSVISTSPFFNSRKDIDLLSVLIAKVRINCKC